MVIDSNSSAMEGRVAINVCSNLFVFKIKADLLHVLF